MEETILIIGVNGQLGRALKDKYTKAKFADKDSLDITKTKSIDNYNWANVRYIINAAAYTNVDGAESSEGRVAAWEVNAKGVSNLARKCLDNDITLLHISSDYVFDGTKDIHSENEPFSPLGVYGQTKAAGDLVVSVLPKYFILRTSWVIGDGNNFVRTMIDLGKKGIEPTVVSDQIGRLTFTRELVRAINHLITNHTAYGTYNISNGGESASWADITRTIFEYCGFNLQVTNTTTKEYYASKEEVAPRPLQSTLSLDKIMSTGFEPHDWRVDLKEYINKELGK